MRTRQEVEELSGKAAEMAIGGTHYPGMSYEQGIDEALQWVLGADNPLEDE